MATVAAMVHDNAPHASVQRAAADLANATAQYALSRGLTAAGAARGTTAAKAKTVNTFVSNINGQFYSLAGSDDFWTLSGTTVAASSFQKYLLLVDTAGAATIQEGVQSTVNAASVTWTNVSNVSRWAPLLTILGSTKCCVATLTIATDSTHTFIPGTTALNAAGITATFADGLDQSILPLIANTVNTLFGLV